MKKMCACVWVERLEMGAKKVCFEPYFVFTGKSFKIDQISLLLYKTILHEIQFNNMILCKNWQKAEILVLATVT